jgi:hypothetical protein
MFSLDYCYTIKDLLTDDSARHAIGRGYEQGAGKPRLERYTRNWLRWLNGGVEFPAV